MTFRDTIVLRCDRRLAIGPAWQEWRGSNPRPSVLETDALPAELHSCTPERSA
jgi:hypothetical protein